MHFAVPAGIEPVQQMHFLRGEFGIGDADRTEAELASPALDASRKVFEVVRVCFSRLRVQGFIVLAGPRSS